MATPHRKTAQLGEDGHLREAAEPLAELAAEHPGGDPLALLLRRYARSGEAAAAEALLAATSPRLLAIARRIAGASDAEDIVNEAYLSLLRLPEVPAGMRVEAWLVTATVRSAYRHLARRRRQAALVERLSTEAGSAAHDSTADPADEAADAEQGLRLRHEVDRLPALYRDAVVLHYWQGLSTAEVGELLDVSRAVVCTRLHRARELLRGRLGARARAGLLLVPWLLADAARACAAGAAAVLVSGVIMKAKAIVIVAVLLLLSGVVLWQLRAPGPSIPTPAAPPEATAPATGAGKPSTAQGDRPRSPHAPTDVEPPPATEEPAVAATATISGSVVGPAGAVPGASVSAHVYARADEEGAAAAPQVAAAGDEGSFLLEGLEPGRSYFLTASAGGLEACDVDLAANIVPAGAIDIVLRLCELPAGVLAGTVVGPQGEPAAARVSLGRLGGSMNSLQAAPLGGSMNSRSQDTDAGGAFRFDPVDSGTLALLAEADGFAPASLDVTLAAGESRVDLVLQLQAGGTLTGRVEDDGGRPLAGADVSLSSSRGGRIGAPAGRTPHTQSAEDGSFALAGLPDDARVQVAARLEGYLLDAHPSAVPGDHVLLVLHRGAIISGRVVDPAGHPVTSYRLWLQFCHGGLMMDSLPASEVKSEDGKFEKGALNEQLTRLVIEAKGYTKQGWPLPLLAPGTAHDLGTLTLSSGVELAGRVLQDGDEPAAGIRVELRESHGPRRPLLSGREQVDPARASAVTRATGEFSFHVTAGDYELVATDPTGRQAVTMATVGTTDVRDIVLRLSAAASLSGAVARGDTALAGIDVRILWLDGPTNLHNSMQGLSAPTDARGEFHFRFVHPGSYEVSLSLGGGNEVDGSLLRRVTVTEGLETWVDFILEDGCTIDGHASGWRGARAAGMRRGCVTLRGDLGRFSAEVRDDGSFAIPGVPAGSYELALEAHREAVRIPAASRHSLEVRLPATTVAGRVRREDGGSLGQATVRVQPMDWGSTQGFLAYELDATGAFEARYLDPGRYVLQAESVDSGKSEPLPVLLAPGQDLRDVELVLGAGADLEVVVLDPQGHRLREASIACLDSSGVLHLPSRRIGETTLAGLGPGSFRVLAGAPGLGTAWLDGVQLRPGSQEVTVSLPDDGATLEASITAGNEPAGLVAITLLDSSGRRVLPLSVPFHGASRTGADGRWTAGRLPPGTYTVRAGPHLGAVAEQNVIVGAAGTATVVLHLRP